MSRRLEIVNKTCKLLKYREGLALQELFAEQVKISQSASCHLLLLQHNPVYTLGKRGRQEDFREAQQDVLRQGIDVEAVPRGGEVTFHGPGQLVAYPIVNLRELRVGARAWIERLEQCVVDTAAVFGVTAKGQVPGRTGVWVEERKLAALGVKISHGISSHGLALNVSTDLSFFSKIVPCGLPDKEVTSLEKETGEVIDMQNVVKVFCDVFAAEFGYGNVLKANDRTDKLA
uniref:lipoyl(octanoyl) transferase n=2 Tax=Tetraselmis sp. GSL018 TaxID=582737 RepID=A0A061S2J0_9CHLO